MRRFSAGCRPVFFLSSFPLFSFSSILAFLVLGFDLITYLVLYLFISLLLVFVIHHGFDSASVDESASVGSWFCWLTLLLWLCCLNVDSAGYRETYADLRDFIVI